MAPSGFRQLHDELLGQMPEGAVHDRLQCPLCAEDETAGGSDASRREGRVSTKTYTEEEVAQAVAEAIKPLEEEAAKLRVAQQSSEVAEQIAAAVEPLETRVSELQAELDEATLRAQTEKDRADGIVAWLDEEGTKAEEAAAVSARKDERVAKVAEVAKFPDEYVEANADRWAAMSDDDFEVALEGWREIASTNGTVKVPTSELPRETAMGGSRDGAAKPSAARELIRMRQHGIDIRTFAR